VSTLRIPFILTAVALAVACSDQPVSGPDLRVDRGDRSISVLSWNVYVGADVDAIILALADENPANDLDALLAGLAELEATDFLVLTDVEYAYLDFGKDTQRPLRDASVEEAEAYLAEEHFLRGSMGPKVEACIRFIRWGGRRAIISSLEHVVEALDGKTGTHIHP